MLEPPRIDTNERLHKWAGPLCELNSNYVNEQRLTAQFLGSLQQVAVKTGLLLGALHIGALFGFNDNLVADIDELRHHHAQAV